VRQGRGGGRGNAWRQEKQQEGELGPDRRGTTRVARQRPGRDARGRHGMVRTGEASGSLMRGPWPTARERGRGEARGAWASPEKKEVWAEGEGKGTILIYSNEF
jgi:hypothetical protein